MTLKLSTPGLITLLVLVCVLIVHLTSARPQAEPYMPINKADLFRSMDEQASRAGRTTWQEAMKKGIS